MIPASSSCISYAGVLVRVPPRGSNYTGSSEKALINALLSNAALANAIQSNQPSQGLPIQPKSLHGYQKNSELGLLGASQGWGWDLLIRDCEKAVTHAYSCPNNPQQNIYTVHKINN